MDYTDIIYGLIASGIIIMVSRLVNKRIMFTNKKCISIDEQIGYSKEYNIKQTDKHIVKELFNTIVYFFNIKACYLRLDDKIEKFNHMDSFKLGENYEEFIKFIEKRYNIPVSSEDKIIDLVIKIKEF